MEVLVVPVIPPGIFVSVLIPWLCLLTSLQQVELVLGDVETENGFDLEVIRDRNYWRKGDFGAEEQASDDPFRSRDESVEEDNSSLSSMEDRLIERQGHSDSKQTRIRPVFDLAQWALGVGQSAVAGVDYGLNGPRPGWGWNGGWGWGPGWGPGWGGPPVGGGWTPACGVHGCPGGVGVGVGGIGVGVSTPPVGRPPPLQGWGGRPPNVEVGGRPQNPGWGGGGLPPNPGGYNPKTFCFNCIIQRKKRSGINK